MRAVDHGALQIGNGDRLAVDRDRLDLAQAIRVGQLEGATRKFRRRIGIGADAGKARLLDEIGIAAGIAGINFDFRPAVAAKTRIDLAIFVLRELQRRRRQQSRQVEAIADPTYRSFEIAAGAVGGAWSDRNRSVRAKSDVDAAGFKRGDQGDTRELDVAEHEGRHVGGGILDDDLGAVGLLEDQVLAVDLDVVDGDVGRQMNDVGGVSRVFSWIGLGWWCCIGLGGLDRLAGAGIDGNRIGLRCRLGCLREKLCFRQWHRPFEQRVATSCRCRQISLVNGGCHSPSPNFLLAVAEQRDLSDCNGGVRKAAYPHMQANMKT